LQQFAYVKAARTVVGHSGSNLHTAIAALPGARIVEIVEGDVGPGTRVQVELAMILRHDLERVDSSRTSAPELLRLIQRAILQR
jgi:capsular polysaccharide biosynthesis protein